MLCSSIFQIILNIHPQYLPGTEVNHDHLVNPHRCSTVRGKSIGKCSSTTSDLQDQHWCQSHYRCRKLEKKANMYAIGQQSWWPYDCDCLVQCSGWPSFFCSGKAFNSFCFGQRSINNQCSSSPVLICVMIGLLLHSILLLVRNQRKSSMKSKRMVSNCNIAYQMG